MTINDLFQLVYVSQAGDDVDLSTLEAIRRESEANNARLGVTGVLLLGGGCFLQLLEGPRDVIAPLYGKIAIDPRHFQPIVLYAGPAKGRTAGEWHMGVIDARPSQPGAVLELAERLEAYDESIGSPGAAMVSLFRELTQAKQSA